MRPKVDGHMTGPQSVRTVSHTGVIMSEIIHVTDENFEEVVSQPNVTVLVDFWAP